MSRISHRPRKAVLLFEVVTVILLVSLISVFLFRGYGIFIRASQKSAAYHALAVLCERKLWQLQLFEETGQTMAGIEREGTFESGERWSVALEDAGIAGLTAASATVYAVSGKESFDCSLCAALENE